MIPLARTRAPCSPAAQAVAGGHVDALALSAQSVQWLADHDARLARAHDAAPSAPAGGCGAFGFRQSDAALRKHFDAALGALLGSPEHAAPVRPFGFTAAELPPGSVRTERAP